MSRPAPSSSGGDPSKAAWVGTSSFAVPAEGAQHGGQGQTGVGDQQQRVGDRGEVDGLVGELEGAVAVAAAGRALGSDAAPRDPGLEVGAGELLGLGRHGVSLVDPVLDEEGPSQERRRLRSFAIEAAFAQGSVGGSEELLGRRDVAVEQLDQAGGNLALQSAVGEAEAFGRPP